MNINEDASLIVDNPLCLHIPFITKYQKWDCWSWTLKQLSSISLTLLIWNLFSNQFIWLMMQSKSTHSIFIFLKAAQRLCLQPMPLFHILQMLPLTFNEHFKMLLISNKPPAWKGKRLQPWISKGNMVRSVVLRRYCVHTWIIQKFQFVFIEWMAKTMHAFLFQWKGAICRNWKGVAICNKGLYIFQIYILDIEGICFCFFKCRQKIHVVLLLIITSTQPPLYKHKKTKGVSLIHVHTEPVVACHPFF